MVGAFVRVTLTGNQCKIETDRGSYLLQGAHRIYFANVLGLEVAEEFPGYLTGRSLPNPQLLSDIITYLKEQDVTVTLNETAKKVLAQIENDESALELSRSVGRKLKDYPKKAIDIPDLKRPLKTYQIPAVAHLVEVKNVANFSVPGSGKTSIALAGYSLLKGKGEIEKLVVIGPRASFMPWEEEFRQCFGRKPASLRLVGSRAVRKKRYRLADAYELILLTYQMANNDAEDVANLLRRHKTMLVLDESHNIKRLEGGKWSDAIVGLSPFATKRVILSGTPIPNSLQDLWSQVKFLWPSNTLLGERDQFKRRIEREGDHLSALVRNELYPFYWRIRKSDLGLPKPRFHRFKVPMGRCQKAIYDILASKFLSELVKAPDERMKLRMWRKARMIRLLQAASNPTLLTEYSSEFRIPPLDASNLPVYQIIEHYSDFETPKKIDFTVQFVKELVKKNQKVLIWTAFIHNIKTLEKMLAGYSPTSIYGDIPKDESENEEFNREKIIREFKSSEKYKVLIANPSACAESISLHKACYHAIYLDRTFNGAHYMQSLDRIHRVGLEKSDKVHYYILESSDTIDEVIDQRLNEKMQRMLELLNDDFTILNLDSPEDEFTEESEEDADFSALVKYLKARTGVT